MTVNFEPGVIMPMPQLNENSPACLRCEGDSVGRIGEQKSPDAQLRREKNARAAVGTLGIDPPLDGNSLLHSEMIGDIVEADYFHIHDLRFPFRRFGSILRVVASS